MKNFILLGVLAAGMTAGNFAQDKPAAPTSEAKPAVAMNEGETKFKELLTNCKMIGRWTPLKDGELGEEKKDQYNIVSATKVKEDAWVVVAKMKYGEKSMDIPVPVQVKFAGDTPVLIVDKLQMPGGGMYSARILFFEKTYAGSWTGQKGGGLLSGMIAKNE